MTSDLARADLEDLRAEGCEPTDDDVVRLHALGVRVATGPEQSAVDAPRFAWAGGVLFHEPTVAAFEWYRKARDLAEDEATDDWLFAFACAHGRTLGVFEAMRTRGEIEAALGAFMGGIHATRGEVVRALSVVTGCAEHVAAEKTDLEKEHERAEAARLDAEREGFRHLEAVLRQAAAATGLTFNDLMAQTPSRLCGMIHEHHALAGNRASRSNAKAYAEYLATLHAVAKRLRAERDARRAAGRPKEGTED